ncbi:MAG TPA: hypothetical protein VF236_02620 [Gaiellaceae bacterium]
MTPPYTRKNVDDVEDAAAKFGSRRARSRASFAKATPGVMRAFEAGDEGLEILAFSPRRDDDRGEIVPGWWSD